MDYTWCTNRSLWRGEIMMEWTSEKYKNNLMEYEKRDGIKAIIIYCLIMGSAFFHGWLYTTNTSVLVLNLSQVWIPLSS